MPPLRRPFADFFAVPRTYRVSQCHDRDVTDDAAPRDELRRRRVARLLLAGGGIAVLAGAFGGNLLAVAFGVGWIIGGGAMSSLEQRETGAEPDGTAGEDADADRERADAEGAPAEDERDR
jgi:hypothetical protein